MLLGAHVSIAGGIHFALDHGNNLGANAIQTFASPPRAIRNVVLPSQEALELYAKKKAESGVLYHVFHGLYLINLAHENPEYVDVCVNALHTYQQLAGMIGGAGTCFHVGSHKGVGFDQVVDTVARAIATVLERTPENVSLMLEITAGQQGAIGVSFEEMAKLMEAIDAAGGAMKRLGIAWDTQHAFASGYPIHTEAGLEQTIDRFDRLIGLSRLLLIHLNDSAVPFESHRDRHENLGEGQIGDQALARIVSHPKLSKIPFILEVPGKMKQGPQKEDVEQLKRYATSFS
jgi:deoxyribonuclease IV